MRGITEERLKALFNDYQHKFLYSQLEKMYEPHAIMNILHMLVDECKELNTWQPIETAPLGKKLWLLMNGSIGIGATEWTLYNDSDRQHFTHWKELPEDPK